MAWKEFGIWCQRIRGRGTPAPLTSRRAPLGLGLCPGACGAVLTVLLAGVLPTTGWRGDSVPSTSAVPSPSRGVWPHR